MKTLVIDPQKTALVLIDFQKGIVARKIEPRAANQVIENAQRLVAESRKRQALIALVHVSFGSDRRDMLPSRADAPAASPDFPLGWDAFIPELRPIEGDLVVTKRQWGAFYGTDLDLQLRRRGIRTIVLGGISTNFGVESTARDAYERGYELVFAEDAMGSSIGAAAHDFVVKTIFPRMGYVRSTEQVLNAFSVKEQEAGD